MRLKKLFLRNFRNYEETILEFSPGLNILLGNNAMGKTNILEAIYLLSTGRSFRTPYLKQAIRKGTSFFFIEAIIEQNDMEESLRFYFDGTNRKVERNRTLCASPHDLLGVMPFILHAPQDVDLIHGSPILRRRFLNLHIAQYDPLYVHHWVRFYRAMKHRNVLLKNRDFSAIDCFEVEMAKSSEYIVAKRKEALTKLKQTLKDSYKDLTQSDLLSKLIYQSSFTTKTSFFDQFKQSREKDTEAGFTLLGPHRDDFQFQLDESSVKAYGSEGQKRSVLYALRFAQYHELNAHHASSAILAFDDFAMHLDEEKAQNLIQKLPNFKQIMITLPEQKYNWPDLETKFFHVENGNVNE